MIKQSIAVIIGAPRAGSTSLFFQLQSHPQISGATIGGRLAKETDYLCRIGEASHGGYLRLWEPKAQSSVLLEASPNYTNYPRVYGISRFLEGLDMPVKLIYILRDPIQRIVSHYRAKGLYPKSLAMDREFHSELLISDYWLQLSQFLSFYRSGNLLFLSFNDLCADQVAVLGSVCEFLGLDSDLTRHWLLRLRPMHANLSSAQMNVFTQWRNLTSVQAFKAGVPLSLKSGYKWIEHSISKSMPCLNRAVNWSPDMASVEMIRQALRPGMQLLTQECGLDPARYFGVDWLR